MNSDFNIAVHALVYLDHKNTQLSSEELAENICTNPARVRKVMAKLKLAGLVSTKEGAVGGYQMERPAHDIDLAQISRILDVTFVKTNWSSGDPDMECLVASGMANIMDGIYDDMNTLCRERLSTITILDIEKTIFGKNPDKAN